jgi:hypothetical protein
LAGISWIGLLIRLLLTLSRVGLLVRLLMPLLRIGLLVRSLRGLFRIATHGRRLRRKRTGWHVCRRSRRRCVAKDAAELGYCRPASENSADQKQPGGDLDYGPREIWARLAQRRL